MGITNVSTVVASGAVEATEPMIYISPVWLPWDDKGWQYAPDLEMQVCAHEAAGHGMGQMEVRYNYGEVKEHYESSYSLKYPKNYKGWWILVRFLNGTIQRYGWMGKIWEQDRTIYGYRRDGSNIETGYQTFIAYDARMILDKTDISDSYWIIDGGPTKIDWIQSMNSRDKYGRLVGNRSTNKYFDTYLYGGKSVWTNLQQLEYVLSYFSRSDFTWSIAGQAWVLDQVEDSIDFGAIISLGEYIRKLIPLELGMGWKVDPTPTGFAITIFSLNSVAYSFNGTSIPVNPDLVRVITTPGASEFVEVNMLDSDLNKYDSVEIIGPRAIVCTSIPMDPQWSTTLEGDYDVGAGGTPEENDEARRADKFNEVYTRFAAPSDYTISKQNSVRNTLDWLPLREGVDYEAGESDNNPIGVEADYQRPTAWVSPDGADYFPAHKVGFNVYAPENEWGLDVEASPNHLHALNTFLGTTETDPIMDYRYTIGTIAFQIDERLTMKFDVFNGGTKGVYKINIPDAQLWYLAPNTVVGTDANNNLKYSGATWRTLRNDFERFPLVMSGLIAQFLTLRGRATLKFHGYIPMTNLVGQILTVVAGQYDTTVINAPITSVRYVNSDTILRTGFAEATEDLPESRYKSPMAEAFKQLRTT